MVLACGQRAKASPPHLTRICQMWGRSGLALTWLLLGMVGRSLALPENQHKGVLVFLAISLAANPDLIPEYFSKAWILLTANGNLAMIGKQAISTKTFLKMF